MVVKVKVSNPAIKITEIKSSMKEIKSEKEEEEISELEQEVSDESIISQMPSGNFSTILPINLQGQQLDASADLSFSRPVREGENTDSENRRNVTYGRQETHRELETKYQLNSAESGRTQNTMVLKQDNNFQSQRLRFENPEQRGNQQGDDNYETKIQTSDVSVKRRREWEG